MISSMSGGVSTFEAISAMCWPPHHAFIANMKTLTADLEENAILLWALYVASRLGLVVGTR